MIVMGVASTTLAFGVVLPVNLGRPAQAPGLAFLAMLACQLLLICGLWRFTKPDPGSRVVGQSNWPGRIARASAVAHFLGWAVIFLICLGGLPARPWAFDCLVRFALVGTAGIAAIALAGRCYAIGRWLPAKAIAWQMLVLLTCVGAAAFGVVAIGAFVQPGALPILGMICTDGFFIAVLWTLVVLIIFADALNRAADAAEAHDK
jgi:hypothetical protein